MNGEPDQPNIFARDFWRWMRGSLREDLAIKMMKWTMAVLPNTKDSWLSKQYVLMVSMLLTAWIEREKQDRAQRELRREWQRKLRSTE